MKRCLLVPGDHFIVGEQRRRMPNRFTIVGGRGFIGTALAASLRSAGHEVTIVAHRDDLAGRDLHHAIYASGIAASSAEDPGYAFGVHVEGARRLLPTARHCTRRQAPLRLDHRPSRCPGFRGGAAGFLITVI